MSNKIKLHIVELHYHAEVLQALLDVLDHQIVEVTVFASPQVASKISAPEHVQLVVVDRPLAHYREQAIACDLLFFNTLADHFGELHHWIAHTVSIVRIHNVNTWFGPQGMAQPKSPYEVWKFTSHYLRKELFGQLSKKRQDCMKDVNVFLFPEQFMLQKAKELRPDLEKQMYQTAISLQTKLAELPKTSSLESLKTIVIPGRIDQRKKDYVSALEVFLRLEQPYEIVLLGAPEGTYGKQVIKSFNEQLKGIHEVVSFDGFVPNDVFNHYMAKADLLFLPIISKTSYTMYREYYGQTKLSGAVNDALAYQKPFLLPKFYPIDERMQDFAIPYSSLNEAIELLTNWTSESKSVDIKSAADNKIQDQYFDLFNALLKKA